MSQMPHRRRSTHREPRENNALEQMSKALAVRVQNIVEVADKTSDPNTGAYDKLVLLIRERDTLHSEELQAEEAMKTAQRRLTAIKEREKEIKAFLERLDRVVAMCLNQDYSPRTAPSGGKPANSGPPS